jgi:CheY-like chemotaxis protein
MATMTTDRELGFALGAAEFLTKPLDWERLAGLLHTYELPGRRREILVVDDDPQARELHRRTLSRDGWVVREAVDGNDALARLAETVPSLVVLDLTMPGLDGFGVLERMRGDTRLHDVPVLVVSGRELSAQEHAALRDAVVQVLQKGGYDRDSLVREVERAARAQSSPTPGLDRAVEGSPAPEVPS